MELIFQLSFIAFLVFLNGYFVASEFALVAIRKTRVDELAKKGNIRAKILKDALVHLDTYISATQLGITIASLALGWFGEPVIAPLFEPLFHLLPDTFAFISAHVLSATVAFTIITFLHIVLGELAPKSLALQRPEMVSLWVITPLILFSKLFMPFIWLLNGAGQLVLRPFGLTSLPEHLLVHSEEEIKMLLSQSGESGAIPTKEVEMVQNIFQLGDIPVKAVMVPRTEILAFNVSTTLKDVVKQIDHHLHSRFPVYENSIDTIIGFIHVKDVYRELLKRGEDVTLAEISIIRESIGVPEVKKIDKVLQEMRRKQVHLAIVSDEFGGTAGIITLEDIIESVVGEIDDEFDVPEKNMTRQKDKTYLINGHTLIEDVQDKFHFPLKGQGYTTIGGLVFGLLGREPHVGDVVEMNNLLFTVEKIEGKRISLLRLKKTYKK